MAQLPYTATLEAPTRQELDQVQEWCLQMWPYTHGATWYQGLMRPLCWADIMNSKLACTWGFQFREDLMMFLLTWSHLVESSQKVDSDE